jgi:hypothetical protein
VVGTEAAPAPAWQMPRHARREARGHAFGAVGCRTAGARKGSPAGSAGAVVRPVLPVCCQRWAICSASAHVLGRCYGFRDGRSNRFEASWAKAEHDLSPLFSAMPPASGPVRHPVATASRRAVRKCPGRRPRGSTTSIARFSNHRPGFVWCRLGCPLAWLRGAGTQCRRWIASIEVLGYVPSGGSIP